MSVYRICVLCSQRPVEGLGSHGTGIMGNCELSCTFWELKLGSMEEQPVLLTIEPSLQPLIKLSYCSSFMVFM